MRPRVYTARASAAPSAGSGGASAAGVTTLDIVTSSGHPTAAEEGSRPPRSGERLLLLHDRRHAFERLRVVERRLLDGTRGDEPAVQRQLHAQLLGRLQERLLENGVGRQRPAGDLDLPEEV